MHRRAARTLLSGRVSVNEKAARNQDLPEDLPAMQQISLVHDSVGIFPASQNPGHAVAARQPAAKFRLLHAFSVRGIELSDWCPVALVIRDVPAPGRQS
jgi:hypothetical protein